MAKRTEIQVIVLNGGTGIAPRDTTFDTIATLLEKTLPRFGEIFRQLSYAEIGSRAITGACNNTLIFSVPSSSRTVKIALEALILPKIQSLATLLNKTKWAKPTELNRLQLGNRTVTELVTEQKETTVPHNSSVYFLHLTGTNPSAKM